jgi:SH3-like domain-containing protein
VPVDLDLDAEAFAALGAFTDGQQSALSPWKGVDAAVTETVRARLAKAGAIDAGGAKQELRPALAAMGAAAGTTTLQFIGSGVLIEYFTWKSGDHGPVGLSAAPDGMFRLQDPAPTEQLMSAMADLVGRCGVRGLDLTLDLAIDDGFVLAAIVDSLRRRLLSGLATGDQVTDAAVDLAQLRATLNEPPTGGFSLFDAIAGLCGTDAVPGADGLTDSLARLARQGLVRVDQSAVGLAGPCAGLPNHFLVISSVVELANACGTAAADDRRLGFTCLQAGVSDLLTVEWVDSGIHLQAVSADTVIGYIDSLVRTPDVVGASAATPQPQQTGPTATTATTAVPRGAIAASPAANTPAWRPTHRVPAAGLPAWATPGAAGVPVARIDAGVELQLVDRTGKWAHVVCANGWSGWVDGEAITGLMRTVPLASPPHVNRPVPPALASAERSWRPTHLVPDGGMAAWPTPDPGGVPVVRIDARVEVLLLERAGQWAHVVCSNGWSGWVDGDALGELQSR